MSEYWDVYDQNREPLGKTIQRGEAFGEGEYYVCCEVWIVNAENQLLITQRNPSKKAGGLWEFTGGGVLAGETTAAAAVREVYEELGLAIRESELTLLDVYRNRNYFMDIYFVRKSFDIADLTLDSNEVVDAKWVSREQLSALISEKKVVHSVASRYDLFHKNLP